MKVNISPVRTFELRRNSATESGGGIYNIAEAAIVDHVVDQDYVTAIGFAVRQDTMSDTAKAQREALITASKVSAAQLADTQSRQFLDQTMPTATPQEKQAVLDTVKTAENSVVPTTVTL
jgi:hypothetical protein